MRWRAV